VSSAYPHVSYLLIDLDETLYPSSSGLIGEISGRMTRFVADYLQLGEEKAARLRRRLSREHGTTLTGLMNEYGFQEPEAYLEFSHPVEVERFLHKDPELAQALSSIPLPKSILTNSPWEHAVRILRYLEIEHLFEKIFDIRFSEFRGKPDKAVYRKVLDELGRSPHEVLFVDNRLDYLLSFQELGGRVLLVSEDSSRSGAAAEVPRIGRIQELPAFLKTLK
jgi:putative hydrolase of the HAD superfamily